MSPGKRPVVFSKCKLADLVGNPFHFLPFSGILPASSARFEVGLCDFEPVFGYKDKYDFLISKKKVFNFLRKVTSVCPLSFR